MKILALADDKYGERIVSWITEHGPANWDLSTLTLDIELPDIVDNPGEFLLDEIPNADLILFLIQDSKKIELLSPLVKRAGAKAAIVAVDGLWLQPGLRRQIEGELEIPSAFPRTFCTLVEQGNPLIAEFARHFGLPEFEIEVEAGIIKKATVTRDAPCGCASFVAGNLPGTKAEDAAVKAGMLNQNSPCMASMEFDSTTGDTLLHFSAHNTANAVERALKKLD
ncbi:MAG: hypothetical protein KKB85_03885 [Candidatus Altiarchaeota archaeon]|nr:hypothetical protein [Candidatus Altiarchaeota archaeon]